MAIQLATARGAEVFTTAGSPEKLELCRSLGADVTINYRDEDFVEVLKAEAGGADVILDNMGAKYLGRNVDALATAGRLVIIGMQGGSKGELDINALLRKRGVRDRDLAARAAPRREGRRSAAGSSRTCGRSSPTGPMRPIVRDDDAARGRRRAPTS